MIPSVEKLLRTLSETQDAQCIFEFMNSLMLNHEHPQL